MTSSVLHLHYLPMSYHKLSFNDVRNNSKAPFDHKTWSSVYGGGYRSSCIQIARHAFLWQSLDLESMTMSSGSRIQHVVINALADESVGDASSIDEEDDEVCPVECVREFKTDEEFIRILEKAKKANSLVVVDFYRTACGSCKYIEQGFSKLCKGSGDEAAPVIFLKHNVMDEYDEQSEVAERLRIKVVPLFHFYKGGVLVEAFATRDKEKITKAILRYSSPSI
ncbi:hypothetical protein Dimus_027977 [Dionaea muscipula]